MAYLMSGLILMGLISLLLLVFLYVAYFRLDEALDNLGNSRGIMQTKEHLGADPIARVLLVNRVTVLLIFYRRSVNSGQLDRQDYRAFPPKLKLLLVLCGWSMLVLSILLVLVIGVGRYKNWIS